MIISKTPFRMSFFGGGTDLKEYFENYGGAVISSTFDKYCYVTVRHLPRFFDYKNQLTYSIIERVSNPEELQHPMVREAMKMLDMHELSIAYDADLPARTGLGTSSSFAVGLLNAFYALKGKYADKKKLATQAIYLERELCKEDGGWQDQIAAAYGGMNYIEFKGNSFEVRPLIIHPERKKELNENLMMFFTGFSHISAEIQTEIKQNIKNKLAQLDEMKELVGKAKAILEDAHSDLNEFGKMLDYTWKLKRQTGKGISTGTIDEMYERAIQAGALGGKLLGAGGGGFLLFYVEKEKREAVKKALENLLLIPFNFENTGTEIIYYSPEQYPQIY
ncbi:MAG: kinase [Alphaproteobacteria bacterium]|nr:kinase [Alphaproteobacteria bacterium]